MKSEYGKYAKRVGTLVTCCCLAAAAGPVHADFVPLSDENSMAVYQATGPNAGILGWTVDGAQRMAYQGLWIGIGDAAETSVGWLRLDELGAYDTPRAPGMDIVFARYVDDASGLTVEFTAALSGGAAGSGVASVMETISVVNTGRQTVQAHLFQYCDFGGSATAGLQEQGWIESVNALGESDGAYDGGVVVTPAPSHYEIGPADELFAELQDDLATTLSDATYGLGAGGDLAWAYQWDMVLSPDESYLISKNKVTEPSYGAPPVPEPGTMSLLALASMALFVRRPRRCGA